MKKYLSAFLFPIFLFAINSQAYEIKWLKKDPEVSMKKDGVVIMTASSAFLLSEVLPIKKIVSIVDVELHSYLHIS